jgi:hypothetical protein
MLGERFRETIDQVSEAFVLAEQSSLLQQRDIEYLAYPNPSIVVGG